MTNDEPTLEDVWGRIDGCLGVFYSLSFKDSVEVPVSLESDSIYRVASGVMLVRSEQSSDHLSDFVVTAGESVVLKSGKKYVFSAIRDCEVYGIRPEFLGEKVDK